MSIDDAIKFGHAKAQLVASHSGMAIFFRANGASVIHDGAVRARMRQILAQGWVPAQKR